MEATGEKGKKPSWGKEQGRSRQEAGENREATSKKREGTEKGRQGTGKHSAALVLGRMGGQQGKNCPRTGEDQAGIWQERQELGGTGKERETSREEAS